MNVSENIHNIFQSSFSILEYIFLFSVVGWADREKEIFFPFEFIYFFPIFKKINNLYNIKEQELKIFILSQEYQRKTSKIMENLFKVNF